MQKKDKILIIGQIPPPYLGQAIMTKYLLESLQESKINFCFINQTSSVKTSSFSKFSFMKLLIVIRTSFQILYYRVFKNCNIIYYNPSGHRKIAILRDISVLWWSRQLFDKTIFHFHAYGIHLVYEQLSNLGKFFFRLAFKSPYLMVKLTQDINPDELLIEPRKISILPNAIPIPEFKPRVKKNINNNIKLVYVGAIYEERGIFDIIDLLDYSAKKNRLTITIDFVGDFMSLRFKKSVLYTIKERELEQFVNFHGVKIDNDKYRIIESANFLIFPSRVPSETFGLVLIEAMSQKTPPIVTNLNGPKFVIKNNINGIKYNPGDIEGLYSLIYNLYKKPSLYQELRNNSYKYFMNNYNIKIFKKNISYIFNNM